MPPRQLDVNGRTYAFPEDPVVVVCIDGSEADYHELAVAAGRMPYLASVLETGTSLMADSAMPSLTNPNNLSIATGVPPSIHGICGNSYFDSRQGTEVLMNDPSSLRVPTLFSAFERAGVRVAVITAKDKLRRLLGHGLDHSVRFSAEQADRVTREDNGIEDVLGLVDQPLPSVYSAELSEFVLAAGVRLLETSQPELMYLTLTDYVQHKYAPGTPQANDFYAMLDSYLAQLDALGAALVITADHGMNAKTTSDGIPQVVYVAEHLDAWLGAGRSHVVLPITDPYTSHHGSLGSFAFVYLDDDIDDEVADRLSALPGVASVVSHDEACTRFDLPADRIGDLAVIADRHTVLGSSPDGHDMAGLDRPLRSHGGLTEQRVPMIVNRGLRPLPDGHRLRNFDAYWIGLNLSISQPGSAPSTVMTSRGPK